MKKPCRKCSFLKPTGEFHKKKGGKWGVDSICKHCTSLLKKERFKLKKAEEKKKNSRVLTYGKELKVNPLFRDPTSIEAQEALNLLLSNINEQVSIL